MHILFRHIYSFVWQSSRNTATFDIFERKNIWYFALTNTLSSFLRFRTPVSLFLLLSHTTRPSIQRGRQAGSGHNCIVSMNKKCTKNNTKRGSSTILTTKRTRASYSNTTATDGNIAHVLISIKRSARCCSVPPHWNPRRCNSALRCSSPRAGVQRYQAWTKRSWLVENTPFAPSYLAGFN